MKNLFTTPLSSFYISSRFLLRAPGAENVNNTPEKDLASTKEPANLKIEIADLKNAEVLKNILLEALKNKNFDTMTDVTSKYNREDTLKNYGLVNKTNYDPQIQEYSFPGADGALLTLRTIRIDRGIDFTQDRTSSLVSSEAESGIKGLIGMEIKVNTPDKRNYDLTFKGNEIKNEGNLGMINTLIENNFANLKTEQPVDVVKQNILEKKKN